MSTYLKRNVRRHWKLLGLTIIIIVAFASSAYAYWRMSASSPTLYVTASSPPLELRMELDKTEFQQNETITVHLFLKNIGSEPVKIAFPEEWVWDHVLRFIVKDENDTNVYIHPILAYAAVYDVVLGPGEQRIEAYEWTQTYNQAPYYGQAFKLGTYKIIGQTMNYGIPGRNLPKDHRLETPPIAVTIT